MIEVTESSGLDTGALYASGTVRSEPKRELTKDELNDQHWKQLTEKPQARGIKCPTKEDAFLTESTLYNVMDPSTINSQRLHDIYQARDDDFEDPYTLEVCYMDNNVPVKEIMFVDPLYSGSRPRMCVSIEAIKSMHRAIAILTRKTDNALTTLKRCRHDYYREICSIREQMYRKYVLGEDVDEKALTFYEPTIYTDDLTVQLFQQRLDEVAGELEHELATAKNENQKLLAKLNQKDSEGGKDAKKMVGTLMQLVPLDHLLFMIRSQCNDVNHFCSIIDKILSERKGATRTVEEVETELRNEKVRSDEAYQTITTLKTEIQELRKNEKSNNVEEELKRTKRELEKQKTARESFSQKVDDERKALETQVTELTKKVQRFDKERDIVEKEKKAIEVDFAVKEKALRAQITELEEQVGNLQSERRRSQRVSLKPGAPPEPIEQAILTVEPERSRTEMCFSLINSISVNEFGVIASGISGEKCASLAAALMAPLDKTSINALVAQLDSEDRTGIAIAFIEGAEKDIAEAMKPDERRKVVIEILQSLDDMGRTNLCNKLPDDLRNVLFEKLLGSLEINLVIPHLKQDLQEMLFCSLLVSLGAETLYHSIAVLEPEVRIQKLADITSACFRNALDSHIGREVSALMDTHTKESFLPFLLRGTGVQAAQTIVKSLDQDVQHRLAVAVVHALDPQKMQKLVSSTSQKQRSSLLNVLSGRASDVSKASSAMSNQGEPDGEPAADGDAEPGEGEEEGPQEVSRSLAEIEGPKYQFFVPKAQEPEKVVEEVVSSKTVVTLDRGTQTEAYISQPGAAPPTSQVAQTSVADKLAELRQKSDKRKTVVEDKEKRRESKAERRERKQSKAERRERKSRRDSAAPTELTSRISAENTEEENVKIAMQEFQDWCVNTFDSPAAVLKHFDTSRNGSISCTEFIERCGVPRRDKPSFPGDKAIWKAIFFLLDTNHSGVIGKPELCNPLTDKFAIKDAASKDGEAVEEDSEAEGRCGSALDMRKKSKESRETVTRQYSMEGVGATRDEPKLQKIFPGEGQEAQDHGNPGVTDAAEDGTGTVDAADDGTGTESVAHGFSVRRSGAYASQSELDDSDSSSDFSSDVESEDWDGTFEEEVAREMEKMQNEIERLNGETANLHQQVQALDEERQRLIGENRKIAQERVFSVDKECQRLKAENQKLLMDVHKHAQDRKEIARLRSQVAKYRTKLISSGASLAENDEFDESRCESSLMDIDELSDDGGSSRPGTSMSIAQSTPVGGYMNKISKGERMRQAALAASRQRASMAQNNQQMDALRMKREETIREAELQMEEERRKEEEERKKAEEERRKAEEKRKAEEAKRNALVNRLEEQQERRQREEDAAKNAFKMMHDIDDVVKRMNTIAIGEESFGDLLTEMPELLDENKEPSQLNKLVMGCDAGAQTSLVAITIPMRGTALMVSEDNKELQQSVQSDLEKLVQRFLEMQSENEETKGWVNEWLSTFVLKHGYVTVEHAEEHYAGEAKTLREKGAALIAEYSTAVRQLVATGCSEPDISFKKFQEMLQEMFPAASNAENADDAQNVENAENSQLSEIWTGMEQSIATRRESMTTRGSFGQRPDSNASSHQSSLEGREKKRNSRGFRRSATGDSNALEKAQRRSGMNNFRRSESRDLDSEASGHSGHESSFVSNRPSLNKDVRRYLEPAKFASNTSHGSSKPGGNSEPLSPVSVGSRVSEKTARREVMSEVSDKLERNSEKDSSAATGALSSDSRNHVAAVDENRPQHEKKEESKEPQNNETSKLSSGKKVSLANGQQGVLEESTTLSQQGIWRVHLEGGMTVDVRRDELMVSKFQSGSKVWLQGLKMMADLNGETGILDEFDASSGRWRVTLDATGTTMEVFEKNITKEDPRLPAEDEDQVDPQHVQLQSNFDEQKIAKSAAPSRSTYSGGKTLQTTGALDRLLNPTANNSAVNARDARHQGHNQGQSVNRSTERMETAPTLLPQTQEQGNYSDDSGSDDSDLEHYNRCKDRNLNKMLPFGMVAEHQGKKAVTNTQITLPSRPLSRNTQPVQNERGAAGFKRQQRMNQDKLRKGHLQRQATFTEREGLPPISPMSPKPLGAAPFQKTKAVAEGDGLTHQPTQKKVDGLTSLETSGFKLVGQGQGKQEDDKKQNKQRQTTKAEGNDNKRATQAEQTKADKRLSNALFASAIAPQNIFSSGDDSSGDDRRFGRPLPLEGDVKNRAIVLDMTDLGMNQQAALSKLVDGQAPARRSAGGRLSLMPKQFGTHALLGSSDHAPLKRIVHPVNPEAPAQEGSAHIELKENAESTRSAGRGPGRVSLVAGGFRMSVASLKPFGFSEAFAAIKKASAFQTEGKPPTEWLPVLQSELSPLTKDNPVLTEVLRECGWAGSKFDGTPSLEELALALGGDREKELRLPRGADGEDTALSPAAMAFAAVQKAASAMSMGTSNDEAFAALVKELLPLAQDDEGLAKVFRKFGWAGSGSVTGFLTVPDLDELMAAIANKTRSRDVLFSEASKAITRAQAAQSKGDSTWKSSLVNELAAFAKLDELLSDCLRSFSWDGSTFKHMPYLEDVLDAVQKQHKLLSKEFRPMARMQSRPSLFSEKRRSTVRTVRPSSKDRPSTNDRRSLSSTAPSHTGGSRATEARGSSGGLGNSSLTGITRMLEISRGEE